MVYRRGNTYYTRIRRRVMTCGTPIKGVAVAMEQWAKALHARHDMKGVLAAIVAGDISLVEAYRLGEDGAAALLAARAAQAADVDLRLHLDEFVAWRRQRAAGQGQAVRYRAQLEVLWPPAAPWPRSTFTAREIARRIDALTGVSDPTRNRYRAACRAFGKYLVRIGLLEHNPARDMEAYAEHPTRIVWYPEPDAQRLVGAIPRPYQVREALMAGCGMDWSDCERLLVGDIDLKQRTVRCRGSKTIHRNRVIRITESWVLPIIQAALAGKLPTAPVCEGGHKAALLEHKRACRALNLAVTTLHDWRHHYAVTLLQRGEKPQVVAHQEGHGNTKLVLDRYGRFIPRLQDYLPELATDPATPLPKEA